MSFFDNFEELISEPVVFILGAGASADYGLPLWFELKSELVNLANDSEFQKSWNSDHLQEISDVILSSCADSTIDEIATDFGSDSYNTFCSMLSVVLVQREAADVKEGNTGWIEIFLAKLTETLRRQIARDETMALETLKNLHFFSLNYDRTFHYHFIEGLRQFLTDAFGNTGFFRRLMDAIPHQIPHLDEFNAFSVFQPHGTIARISRNYGTTLSLAVGQKFNQEIVPYGDIKRVLSLARSNGKHPLLVVNDFKFGMPSSYPTYKQCNFRLRKKNVVLLGLSENGIANSKFDFSMSKSVFTNLETIILLDETKSRLGKNLVVNEKFIRADDFSARL